MTIEVYWGDQTWAFDHQPGVSLLDQILAHSAPISYSCRRGDCGQCAVSLVEGEVEPLDVYQPLWQAGSLLTCNAVSSSAVKIRIPYDPELDAIKVLRSPAKIHALNRLSADVIELTLRLPPTTEFRFLPGQYIRITIGGGTIRSYSLAAGPMPDRMLRIHIRRVTGGRFSDWLFERATANELVHVEGPQGRFFLRQNMPVRRSIFLATGTGIAPILAILSASTPQQFKQLGKVSIYWGNRTRKDAYVAEKLEAMAAQMDFRFSSIFSRETTTQAQTHRHVQHQMLAEHPQLGDAQLFACGNAEMITSAREIALAAGLPPDRFHSDSFTAS